MNRRNFVSTVAGLSALATTRQTRGAGPATTTLRYTKAFEAVSRECRRLLDLKDDARTAGLSLTVAIGDTIEYAESFGHANLEWQLPVTRTTRFRVGSISKLLTSVGLGILVERGKIDLDAPITRYAPYPMKGKVITVRQLAGHTSGIPQYGDGMPEGTGVPPGADPSYYAKDAAVYRYTSLTAAMEKYKNRPLLFEPGTRFHYSSFGWNLIGAAIEQVTGQLFVDFMRESVFVPLGMTRTIEDDAQRIIPERTEFYFARPDGSLANAPYVDNSDVYPGGGFLSTPDDLVKLGLALRAGKPISPATWAMLKTPGPIQNQQKPQYRTGLGWRTLKVAGHELVGHEGRHHGCQAIFDTMSTPAPVTLAIAINCTSPKNQANTDQQIRDAIVRSLFG